MAALLKFWGAEPVLVSSLVSAIIVLAVAFGLNLSVQQIGAIGGVVLAINAIIIRSQVSPTP